MLVLRTEYSVLHHIPDQPFCVGSWLSTIAKETNRLNGLSKSDIDQERRASIVAATECFGKIACLEGELEGSRRRTIVYSNSLLKMSL